MAKLLRELIPGRRIKIEVGSGSNPQPGYLHVDVDSNMPDLTAVCQMGKENLPFPDNCAEEILSNHSIEHVSWLDVGNVVADFFRVLAPGGKLFLRTPDLEFICKKYLEKKQTPEAAEDESNMVHVFGDCGPAHWANIKLFAGQNYSGNFHYFCLDYPMLEQLLKKHGFVGTNRVDITPIFSPGELQVEAFKPLS